MLLNETMYEFLTFHLAVINKNLSFAKNNGTRDIGRLYFPKLIIRYLNLERFGNR